MSAKQVFPRALVRDVFLQLWHYFDSKPTWSFDDKNTCTYCLHSCCDRFCAVGGYRRGKLEMKDLEILYIPRMGEESDPGDLFGSTRPVNLPERLIESLEKQGVIERRISNSGNETWGALNELARHKETGLAIDLFAATSENWYNRLVVTTGPKELNVEIASKARRRIGRGKSTRSCL